MCRLKWVGVNQMHQLLGKRQRTDVKGPWVSSEQKTRTLIAMQRNSFGEQSSTKYDYITIKRWHGKSPLEKRCSEQPLKGVFLKVQETLSWRGQRNRVGGGALHALHGFLLEFLVLMRRTPLPGLQKDMRIYSHETKQYKITPQFLKVL